MNRPVRQLPTHLLLLAAVMLVALVGCSDATRRDYATEADEPYFRQADQMKRGNRHQEALSAYLKVIEKRGDDAPESHLEAGLVYLHHIRDPIAAIYHFRKYLALRPNSAQAPLVRQRIDAAIRDFARTLPAQPVESQLQRVDLMAALDKSKLENDILKQQLADYQGGRESSVALNENSVAGRVAAAREANDFKISVDTLPTVRTRPPVRTEPSAPPPQPKAEASRTPAATKTSPTANRAGARRHIVKQGDTLSKLSQQYFGNRTRWRDIYQANRSVMKNDADLKVGMELVIPQ